MPLVIHKDTKDMTFALFRTAIIQAVQLPLGTIVAFNELQSLIFEGSLDATFGCDHTG